MGVAVTVLRHPRSKNMSWLTSDHDFVPYPSDRKNSYDMMVVTPPLLNMNDHLERLNMINHHDRLDMIDCLDRLDMSDGLKSLKMMR